VTPTAKEDPDRAAVIAYLEKMGEIEARRKGVVTNLLPGMMAMSVLKGMMGRQAPVREPGEGSGPGFDPASLNLAGETRGDYRGQLRAIEAEARAVRPPAPAAAFHQGYLAALRSYGGVIDEICASMMRLDRSLGTRMGALQARADRPLASADGELGDLFRRYELPRTFSVGDGEGGNVMY
jgi:hypothetical protein